MVSLKRTFPHKKEILSLTLLFFITIIFFQRGLISDTTTILWDASDYFYPMLAYNAKCIQNGILPLWNPFIFNGYPSFADPQAQTFYPINYIASIFTNFTPKVIYGLLAFHFFLSGSFMFLLCRHLKYNFSASIVGAISFMFSGFLLGHFQHYSMICSVAFLPATFLFLDKALAERDYKYALIGAIFLCFCILAGHPQTYFYICFVLGVHWIYRTISIRKFGKGEFYKAIIIGLLFFSIGILLSMVQLLPTLELIQLSNRDLARSLSSSGSGIKFINMITLFLPNYFGGITAEGYFNWKTGIGICQQNLYMGVLPIFLSIWAMVASRGTQRIYYGIGAVLALVISMGINTPIFYIFFHVIPGFSFFQFIARFLFVFHFFVAILAAEGMASLSGSKTTVKSFGFYSLVFLLGVILYHVILPDPPGDMLQFETLKRSLHMFFLFFGIICGTVLLFLWKLRKRLAWMKYMLVAILFCDMFFLTSGTITVGGKAPGSKETSPHELKEQAVEVGSVLARHAGFEPGQLLYDMDTLDLCQIYNEKPLFRIYLSRQDQPNKIPRDAWILREIGFNRAFLHRLFLVDGYSPVVTKQHAKLSEVIGNKNIDRLVDLCNGRYHVVIKPPQLPITIHTKPLSRAMMFEHAEFMENEDKILEKLSDRDFNPHKTVIIEGNTKIPSGDAHKSSKINHEATVKLLSYFPNRVEMESFSTKNAFMLFNDSYYPGWRVLVDGKPEKVLKANYNFKAVQLPYGTHHISFIFDPVSLKVGAFITTFTFMGILTGLFFLRRK